jgi:meiotically up-regulated gene 157 (Mug157) protein
MINNLRNQEELSHFPPAFPVISRGEGTKLSAEALEMCTRTLWHTLETTTIVLPNEEAFIHTGDIDDLWLRVRSY